MGTNFLFLKYDDFCKHPEKGVAELLHFLGLEDCSLLTQLIEIVNPPNSIGRFKQHGTEMFGEEDIAFVKLLGFDVK
jgi:hypothetical protein